MSEKVTNLSEYKAALATSVPKRLKDGDGSGTFDDMQARVAVLENMTKRIESTLDRIDARTGKIAEDVSGIKEGIKALASAEKVGEITGSLKDKPSTWQTVIISLAISGLTVAAALGGAAKLLGK